MFLKQNLFRVCVFYRFHSCRLISSGRMKDAEFSATNVHAIQQFDDIPKAERLPLIGTKLDFLRSGFGKRFVY